MEIDKKLIWFLGAIKSCVVDDIVDEKKLNKNISDCTARVKSACSTEGQEFDFDDFKLKSTLVLLLCCPSIRSIPAVQNSKEFQSVFVTFPILSDSAFFSVVRSQKLFKFLYPLISQLPPSTIGKLMQEFFTRTNDVTPVTLAMTLELVRSFVSSCHKAPIGYDVENGSSEILKLVLKFYATKKVSCGSKAEVKSSAYLFMYLFECVYSIMSSFIGRHNEEPIIRGICQVWSEIWNVERDQKGSKKSVSYADILKCFFSLCEENIKLISVDLWMEWSEVMLPPSIIVHRKSISSQKNPQQNSIQSIICNIAFDILRIVEAHSDTKNLVCEAKDLFQFVKQIAADPEYDPDEDLDRERLLSEINLKDERLEKLVGILLKRDDIFESEECVDSITSHLDLVDVSLRHQILLRFIQHLKQEKNYCTKSVEMVLKMAEAISSEELLVIIENDLSSGLDERLKMPSFNQQLTLVFNQLAEGSSGKNSSKHVWLCLQSGQSVVSEAVRQPIVFPGLVNVIVQALTAIPQVCKVKEKSGLSVLIKELQARQLGGLQGREEKDFGDLVKGLIKAQLVDVTDVLHYLVQPFLKFDSQSDLIRISLPVDLLTCIVHHNIGAIVKPGPELVSLILTLAYVINATSVFNTKTLSINSKLRTDALSVLHCICRSMLSDRENYERDISMLKQTIINHKLLPQSFLPLRELLDCNEQVDSPINCLLLMITTLHLEQLEGKPVHVSKPINIPDMLKNMSKEEWIISLVQILPHCDEEEWRIVLYIMHNHLKSEITAMDTMMIFQRVLYLICTQAEDSTNTEDDGNGTELSSTSLSMEHCFKSFSNAAMIYLEDLMEGHPYSKRFLILCSVFRWWCSVRPLFPEDQEVPSLFLLQIILYIEEMINSKKLILFNDKKLQKKDTTKKMTSNLEEDGCHSAIDGIDIHINGIEDSNIKPIQNSHNDVWVNGVADSQSKEQESVDGISERLEAVSVNEIEKSTLTTSPVSLPLSVYCKEDELSVSSSVNEIQDGNHIQEFCNEMEVQENGSMELGKFIYDNKIGKNEFYKYIRKLTVKFLKFFPPSNLTSSVAGKMKRLLEIT